jgi:hypothetical protein
MTTAGNCTKLRTSATSRREKVALELAGGATIRAAAKAAGCSPRTVSTYLADPAFRAEVAAIRGRLVDETLGMLSGLARKAVGALERCLEAESEGARVRAALGVLDRLLKVREATEIDQRLRELETHIAKQRSRTNRKA